MRSNLPTVLECWTRLEQLDDLIAKSEEFRKFCSLKKTRAWWADQLLLAQTREGYPQQEPKEEMKCQQQQ